jgi:hypothetical protein
MMLLGYSVYVWPDADYAVAAFRHKTDQRDNAIGYQKAAMVFHMLRREIGEEAFWKGLKLVVGERGGRHTTWTDLEGIFGRVAGRELRWFFTQWVERPGAPSLALDGVQRQDIPEPGHQIEGRVIQKGQVYRLRVPIEIELETGEVRRTELRVNSADEGFRVSVSGVPRRVRVDPDFELFRRMDRDDLPPMLNLFVTDRQRTVILPVAASEAEIRPYQDVATRLQLQADEGQAIVSMPGADPESLQGSVMVLGGADMNLAAGWIGRMCADKVTLQPDGFTVEGHQYQGPDFALLLSCRNPRQPGSVVTLFYGTTAAAAAKVARLLFFYGWQSYLVFRDGAVVARGDFNAPPRGLEAQVRAQ